MFEQLSLFDFMEKETNEPAYPPIILELRRELLELFKGYEIGEDSYYTWYHAPNLGKRYSFIVDYGRDNEYIGGRYKCNLDLGGCDSITERYKAKQLDVSFDLTPWSLYVFTIWMTKGHKEVI